MITAVLEHRGDTLVTELPCGLYELQAELSSIGITWQSSSLPVSGTEAVHVELAADGPVGEMVLSHMGCTDLFLDLNRVCQKGYVLLDMTDSWTCCPQKTTRPMTTIFFTGNMNRHRRAQLRGSSTWRKRQGATAPPWRAISAPG